MDIVAHGLWAAAAASGARKKLHRKVRVGWTALFGVFPDLFAFTVPITLMVWQRLTDPAQAAVQAGGHRLPHMPLAWQLYQISHSLVVFAVVFGLVCMIARRPVLELLGWPLHILIDIPTHTSRFFATPFLWPISSYRASGISWGNPWFMLCNYSALAIVYFLLWRASRQAARAPEEMAASSRAGLG
jgi:hypothetical protein